MTDKKSAFFARLWPRQLAGQIMLLLALALLLAQLVNALLLWQGEQDKLRSQTAIAAATRLIGASEFLDDRRVLVPRGPDRNTPLRFRRIRVHGDNPVSDSLPPSTEIAARIGHILDEYAIARTQLVTGIDENPRSRERSRDRPRDRSLSERDSENMRALRARRLAQDPGFSERKMLFVAMQRPDGLWLETQIRMPAPDPGLLINLIVQTMVLYLALLIPAIWLTRRLSASLRQLREGLADFHHGQSGAALPESGPEDIAVLIRAFNAMRTRISALFDEKDIMLGAIGHDLKTPLAALRVRVESVDDDDMRDKMIASIADMDHTLDDILTLARIGRTAHGFEKVNLAALVDTLVQDYQDMGRDVALGECDKITVRAEPVWLRRALRNLIDNALHYGQRARITLTQDSGDAIVAIDDDGPGLAEADMEAMFRPFVRADKARGRSTGGTGLGLTLAQTIAERHGGQVRLENRRDTGDAYDTGDTGNRQDRISGLTAILRFPANI